MLNKVFIVLGILAFIEIVNGKILGKNGKPYAPKRLFFQEFISILFGVLMIYIFMSGLVFFKNEILVMLAVGINVILLILALYSGFLLIRKKDPESKNIVFHKIIVYSLVFFIIHNFFLLHDKVKISG